MDSLYTDNIKSHFFTRKWPSKLIVDIEESDEPAPHLNFVLYRDNFNRFDGEDQKQIASLMQECLGKFRKDGIPCYLEVRASVPRT